MRVTDATPAGWYPAPAEPGLQRYWDGATWSEERRPLAPVGSGSVASLVLGIIAVVTSPFLIGFLFGIVATAIAARRDPKAPISTAGRILGYVGILLTVLFGVLRGLIAANS